MTTTPSSTVASADTPQAVAFRRTIQNPLKLRLFMLRSLPMAYLAGLRVRDITPAQATVTVPFKYLTKNPFRSIYFACLSMAAEMASGVLSLMYISSGPPVSMLVTGMEAEFTKKAVGLISFTTTDGAQIGQAIAESRATGEGRTVVCTSTGTDQAGDVVAIFRITWSYRAKKQA
ncbi:PaaI family thioesterase [Hymenobacter sp. HD11105]